MINRLLGRNVLIVSFLLLFFSCQKDIKKKEAYRNGNLTLAVDPSFLNLATALVDVFQASYPGAKITFKPEVEDLVIADLVNGKISMAMTGRDLTIEETKILYNRTKINHIPTQIACDATVFIVSKESSMEEVDFSLIKSEIESDNSKFVFDGGNSSNYNNIKNKIGFEIDKNQKINSFTDADEVIDFISKNASYIGIIGFNVLSDQNDPKVKQILSKIKIVPVKDIKNTVIYPTVSNLKEGIYPFTKRIFLLNTETSFAIGSSFARFCGTQRGQLIVARAGLQPYYLYERRVEMR